jgi:hypothetical protein
MPEAVRVTLRLLPGVGDASGSTRERRSAEPQLVFKTIARLYLSDAVKSSTVEESVGNGGARPM